MKHVENTELVQQHLGRWAPQDLAYVEAFEYESSSNGRKSRLKLVTLFQKRVAKWPSQDQPTIRVTLEFEGVSNSQIKAVGAGPKQVTGFDIRDVSGDGWEGINFVVEDYEADQISFNCRKIRVIDSALADGIPLP